LYAIAREDWGAEGVAETRIAPEVVSREVGPVVAWVTGRLIVEMAGVGRKSGPERKALKLTPRTVIKTIAAATKLLRNERKRPAGAGRRRGWGKFLRPGAGSASRSFNNHWRVCPAIAPASMVISGSREAWRNRPVSWLQRL